MQKSFREADPDVKIIETQIQELRDEIQEMMATIGKLSQEFSKVLMIFSNETSETDESSMETLWGKQSFS